MLRRKNQDQYGMLQDQDQINSLRNGNRQNDKENLSYIMVFFLSAERKTTQPEVTTGN